MKLVLALLSLTSALIACDPKRPPNWGKSPEIDRQSESAVIPDQMMSPKDANGVSTNAFSFALKPGHPKIAFIPFQYDTEQYSHVKVSLPEISAEGCTGKPEIRSLNLQTHAEGKAMPLIYWEKGWPAQLTGDAGMAYEVEEESDTHSKETVTLMFVVPGDCTRLNGKFTATFR